MKSDFENRILEGKRKERKTRKRKKKEKSKKNSRLFESLTVEYPAWFIAAS